MKKTLLALLVLQLSLFTACNSEKAKTVDNAHQNVTNTRSFPRPAANVICHNCTATFKVSSTQQKSNGKHSYIECPVCKHDYLKKAK